MKTIIEKLRNGYTLENILIRLKSKKQFSECNIIIQERPTTSFGKKHKIAVSRLLSEDEYITGDLHLVSLSITPDVYDNKKMIYTPYDEVSCTAPYLKDDITPYRKIVLNYNVSNELTEFERQQYNDEMINKLRVALKDLAKYQTSDPTNGLIIRYFPDCGESIKKMKP